MPAKRSDSFSPPVQNIACKSINRSSSSSVSFVLTDKSSISCHSCGLSHHLIFSLPLLFSDNIIVFVLPSIDICAFFTSANCCVSYAVISGNLFNSPSFSYFALSIKYQIYLWLLPCGYVAPYFPTQRLNPRVIFPEF